MFLHYQDSQNQQEVQLKLWFQHPEDWAASFSVLWFFVKTGSYESLLKENKSAVKLEKQR